MKEIKEAYDSFIKDWGAEYWKYVAGTGIPHEENIAEFKAEFLSILRSMAEDAWKEGYDNVEYPPKPTFDDYWKQFTDSINE